MCRKQWSERDFLFLAAAFILLFVSPLFLLGENAHIRVHDNLDSNIAWYKVLKESGEAFGKLDAKIPQVINGLPRHAIGTEWCILIWLHLLFPSMTAYAISQTLTRSFAFIGMYLLLKSFFVPEKELCLIAILVSLAFSWTPFWPSGMLSTLGHPLALWSFLHIRKKTDRFIHWIVLILLPFYASFVLGFFFFLCAMAGLWVLDGVRGKTWNLRFLLALFLMSGVFFLTDFRLFYATFFHSEPIHRLEFISSRHGVLRSLRLALKNFVLGHTHVMTVHMPVIFPVTLYAAVLMIRRREWKKEKTFFLLLLFNFALSLWYAFWFNRLWIPLKNRIDLLNTFNFARFHFLRPFIIYLGFALACRYLRKTGYRRMVPIALMAQLLVLVPFNEEIHYRLIHHAPSFRQFYAEKQFQEIARFIGRPKSSYRVVSLGLHPAVAQYNGFYTLDTYSNIYPLTYKYKFRKIIAEELGKSETLRLYFDEWGSRCYVFASELGKKFDYGKNTKKRLQDLDINTHALYELGGRYIFSAVPIDNAHENGLRLTGVFSHPDSAWKIYLYEVHIFGNSE